MRYTLLLDGVPAGLPNLSGPATQRLQPRLTLVDADASRFAA